MNHFEAAVIYLVKANGKGHPVDYTKCQTLSPRVVVLKDTNGKRLACVVESKKGYVVDICKKNHQ